MKKRISAVLMLGMLAAWPVSQARADEPAAQGMDHHRGMEGFKERLGLSDDQATRLKTLMESEKTVIGPLWEKQRAFIKKLDWQISAKATDADIQSTLNDLRSNRKAMKEQMEKLQTQKDAILTPTQQAKMVLMRANRFRHGHEQSFGRDEERCKRSGDHYGQDETGDDGDSSSMEGHDAP